ncbi:hypothetical protein EDB80DRAFT_701905 [Ilyonectria destructans]|nr:hypothetical protein EDB80DRAFT_701905 [Ilyonectria destructans]
MAAWEWVVAASFEAWILTAVLLRYPNGGVTYSFAPSVWIPCGKHNRVCSRCSCWESRICHAATGGYLHHKDDISYFGMLF